jgi:hypothetical protein
MLRKHAQKLRLKTETIHVLTRLQAARVQGGKTVPSAYPCTTTNTPTEILCDASDSCQ